MLARPSWHGGPDSLVMNLPSSPGFTTFLREFGSADVDMDEIASILQDCGDLVSTPLASQDGRHSPAAGDLAQGFPAALPGEPAPQPTLSQAPSVGGASCTPQQQQQAHLTPGARPPALSGPGLTARLLQRSATDSNLAGALAAPAAMPAGVQLQDSVAPPIRAASCPLQLPKLLSRAAVQAVGPGRVSQSLLSATPLVPAVPDVCTAAANQESPFVTAVAAAAAVGASSAAAAHPRATHPAAAAGAHREPGCRQWGPTACGAAADACLAAAPGPTSGFCHPGLSVHASSSSHADASVGLGQHLLDCSQDFLASVSHSLRLYAASDTASTPLGTQAAAGPAAHTAEGPAKQGGSRAGGGGATRRKSEREPPKHERELQQIREQMVRLSSEQAAMLARVGELEAFQGNLQSWLTDMHAAWQSVAAANQQLRGGAFLQVPLRCM